MITFLIIKLSDLLDENFIQNYVKNVCVKKLSIPRKGWLIKPNIQSKVFFFFYKQGYKAKIEDNIILDSARMRIFKTFNKYVNFTF